MAGCLMIEFAIFSIEVVCVKWSWISWTISIYSVDCPMAIGSFYGMLFTVFNGAIGGLVECWHWRVDLRTLRSAGDPFEDEEHYYVGDILQAFVLSEIDASNDFIICI